MSVNGSKSRDFAQQLPALHRLGHYLGTIIATTSAQDNSSTAVPFVIPTGVSLMVQSDADCYVSAEHDHTALTSANGTGVASKERYTFFLWSNESQLAALAVTGTVNVKVYKLENG